MKLNRLILAVLSLCLTVCAVATAATITIQTDDGRTVQVQGNAISVDGRPLPATQPAPPAPPAPTNAVDVPPGTKLTSDLFQAGKTYNLSAAGVYTLDSKPDGSSVSLPAGVTIQCTTGRAIIDGSKGGYISPGDGFAIRGVRFINFGAGNAINGNRCPAGVLVEDCEYVSASSGEASFIWAEGDKWIVRRCLYEGNGYCFRWYGTSYYNSRNPTKPARLVGQFSVSDCRALTASKKNLNTVHFRCHGEADARSEFRNCESVYRIGDFDFTKAFADPTAFYNAAKAAGALPDNWTCYIVAPNGGGDNEQNYPGMSRWKCDGVQITNCTGDGGGLRVGRNASANVQNFKARCHGDAIYLEETTLVTTLKNVGVLNPAPQSPNQGNKAINLPNGVTGVKAEECIQAGDPRCDLGPAALGFTRVGTDDARWAALGFKA